jgi:hypothetical protein
MTKEDTAPSIVAKCSTPMPVHKTAKVAVGGWHAAGLLLTDQLILWLQIALFHHQIYYAA